MKFTDVSGIILCMQGGRWLFLVLFSVSVSWASEDLVALEIHVKQNPSDLKSVHQLAVGLFKEEKYQESLRYLKYLVRQRPDDPKLRFALARCFYKAGQVDEALIQCHRIQKQPGGEKCGEMFTAAENEFPDSFRYYQARLLFSEKKIEESRQILNELLENDIENRRYRGLLASHYRVGKQFEYAWDNYQYATEKEGKEEDESSDKMVQGLQQIGKSAYEFAEARMGNHESEADAFFDRLFYATKLYEAEALRRMRGLLTKAIDHYQAKADSSPDQIFTSKYRVGCIYMALGDSTAADKAFSEALDEAPDDLLYATVEYLRTVLQNRRSKEKNIEDLIAMAGGEDVYNTILKAAEDADRTKLSQFENEQTRAAAEKAKSALSSINKEEFIAEFDNFKRRMASASSEAEKAEIKAELQSKYGHLMSDPNARSQLEAYMSTSEGQKLKEQYSGQIDSLKAEAQKLK